MGRPEAFGDLLMETEFFVEFFLVAMVIEKRYLKWALKSNPISLQALFSQGFKRNMRPVSRSAGFKSF